MWQEVGCRGLACHGFLYDLIKMTPELTLLCVDDEENGLKMRKWLFETEGFRVLTALDGPTNAEALGVLQIRPSLF